MSGRIARAERLSGSKRSCEKDFSKDFYLLEGLGSLSKCQRRPCCRKGPRKRSTETERVSNFREKRRRLLPCTLQVQTLHGFDMRSASEKQTANNEALLLQHGADSLSALLLLQAPKESECFSLRIADDSGSRGICIGLLGF